jgi:manganese/zinc/iron transport system ATP- binding protein
VRTEHAVLELLRTLRDDEGRSIVIVHHDLETVARSFDWALLLNVRPIATGRPDEVLTPENLRRAYGAEPAVEPTAAAGSWAG